MIDVGVVGAVTCSTSQAATAKSTPQLRTSAVAVPSILNVDLIDCQPSDKTRDNTDLYPLTMPQEL